jgi:L-ascorbate metabolism protein UlaG (beta-lactamase superfamily)
MKTILTIILMTISFAANAQNDFEEDVIQTSSGELKISFVGHGTLMLDWNSMIIHIDPVSREADYSKLPDADLVLITHHHGDHLDAKALKELNKSGTEIILTSTAKDMIEADNMALIVMKNGDTKRVKDINIKAIPSYNIVHKRDDGEAFHPKGVGNAYVLEIGDKRILIGGDTENIPEIKELKEIDIAFLPMNLPYTMTPEMVADAAKAFKPGILYPYHYGNTDTDKLIDLMKDEKSVEVRIRKM